MKSLIGIWVLLLCLPANATEILVPVMEWEVEYCYGTFDTYSRPPRVGESATINFNKMTKTSTMIEFEKRSEDASYIANVAPVVVDEITYATDKKTLLSYRLIDRFGPAQDPSMEVIFDVNVRPNYMLVVLHKRKQAIVGVLVLKPSSKMQPGNE